LAHGPAASVVAVRLVDGTCPATDYLCDIRCRARFQVRFDILAQRGTLKTPELMRRLGGEVWEVKVADGPGRRAFGCWYGKVFVVTHAADKPKSGLVSTEIRRANQLFAYWRRQEGLT